MSMRKLTHPAIFLLVALLLTGCIWRYGVNGRHFTQPGGNVEIDSTAFRMDGYYAVYLPYEREYVRPVLFWKDGTVRWTHHIHAYPEDDDGESAHEQIVDALARKTGARQAAVDWGGFRIYGDSIAIQVMGYFYMRMYDPFYYDGYILNDTTIVITSREEPASTFGFPREREYFDPPKILHFHPLEPGEKPSSDNWTQTHRKLH